MKIKFVSGRQILDSRGDPTIECDVVLENGIVGRASVPSGKSTGGAEALELRDGDNKFGGKGVMKAINNLNNELAPIIVGKDVENQEEIDNAMKIMDGTSNKSRLGANAILAVSLAVCKAAARSQNLPLWKYISNLAGTEVKMPIPMFNIINGGAHAGWTTDIQEYMIVPMGERSFSENLRIGSEIFHHLGKVLTKEKYQTTVGDEGGYAPRIRNGNDEPMFLINKAVRSAVYKLGHDVTIALDIAASGFYEEGKYRLKADRKTWSSDKMIDWYQNLVKRNHVSSIEDGLAENDWPGWMEMTEKLGNKVQIVGDDLLVTNTEFLKRAIEAKAANAILIKPNQIGTVSETLAAIRMAKENDFNVIVSHRSGETEDTFIAHLAVGTGAEYIKTGSLSRGERIAKYNELLRIEEQLSQLVD